MKAFFALLLPLLLVLPLAAAPAAKRGFRVVFLGAGNSDLESAVLADGSAFHEVELPRMNLSPVYPLPPGDLVLQLMKSRPVEDEELPKGLPSVKLAAGTTNFYLLVSPDPSNVAFPLRLQVIDAGGADFKPGGMMWFNLTPHDIGGTLGDHKLAIHGGSRIVLGPPVSEAGSYPVDLSFRITGNDQVYPLCETKWRHDPAARTLWFIFIEPGTRTPRILGFPDHREPAPETP